MGDPPDRSRSPRQGLLEAIAAWPAPTVAAAVLDGRNSITPQVIAIEGDPYHRFEVASLTKPMVAWAMLVAAEEGTVDLDEPAREANRRSLRELLSHASGYPFNGSVPVAPAQTQRIYSNAAYEVAADVLERRSGLEMTTYLTEAVFAPLNMAGAELIGSAAYGVEATLSDIIAFVLELFAPRLISAETAADAYTPQYPDLSGIVPGVGEFRPCPWGLGLEIAGDKAPHWMGRRRSSKTVGHFGGGGSMMWFDPSQRLGLIALSDLAFDRWSGSAVRLWSALSDHIIEALRPSRSSIINGSNR